MTAAPVEPTSRLRVVTGEEELLRSRAVAAVRASVAARHPDVEEHELVALGLPPGQLAEVLAPSLFGGHRLVVVQGVHEAAGALADELAAYGADVVVEAPTEIRDAVIDRLTRLAAMGESA